MAKSYVLSHGQQNFKLNSQISSQISGQIFYTVICA